MENQATTTLEELLIGNGNLIDVGNRWAQIAAAGVPNVSDNCITVSYDDRLGNIMYRNPHNDWYRDVINQTSVTPGVNAWTTGAYTGVADVAVTTVPSADIWTMDSITSVMNDMQAEDRVYNATYTDTTTRHPYEAIAISKEDLERLFVGMTRAEAGNECVSLNPEDLYGSAEGEDANG